MKDLNKKEKSSDLVVQHNDLIGAKRELTLQEYRVILWLISKVKIDDEDFKEHELNVTEFCNLVGISPDCMYERLSKITENLMKRVITIKTLNESKELLEQVAILSYARYEKGQGRVVLSFHPRMGRFLLDLQNNFTKTSLSISLKFSRIYSLRFYEFMRRNMFSLSILPEISELRSFFGIKAEQYQNYKDFKKHVLKPAIEEVNKKSDIEVEWSEIKKGKKVEIIRFLVREKKDDEEKNKVVFSDEFLEKEYAITKHSLDQLRKEFSERAIQQGLEVLTKHKRKLRNPLLFLRSAIKEGWQPFLERKSINNDIISTQCEIDGLDEGPVIISFRKSLLEKLGEQDYNSWIKPLVFNVEGENIIVSVRSKFVKDWVENNFLSHFRDYADGRQIVFNLDPHEKMNLEQKIESNETKTVVQRNSNRTLKKKNVKEKIERNKNDKKPKQKTELPVQRKSLWERIKGF